MRSRGVALLGAIGVLAAQGCGGKAALGDTKPPGTGGTSAAPAGAPGDGTDASSRGGGAGTAGPDAGGERPLGGGFVATQAGFVHRPAQGTCDNRLPPPSNDAGIGDPAPDASGIKTYCRSDHDCSAGAFGRCVRGVEQTSPYPGATFVPVMQCTYGCVTDDQCEAGQLCRCGADIGVCVATTCTTDDDCAGRLCLEQFAQGCDCQWSAHRFDCGSIAQECTQSTQCGPTGFCVNGACGREICQSC